MNQSNRFVAKLFDANNMKKHVFWLYIVIFIISALSIWKGGEALRNQQVKELRIDSFGQLNQLASVLENAIAKYQHMPTLLASNDRVSKALRDGFESDINQLNRELEQINRITEASDSYILNTEGLTIAASNYRETASFVGRNFAFRPYFKDAMQGKPGRYYALGTTSNRRGYYFSYPVYEGDSIIGVAVVKVDLTQFEKRFANQHYEFLLLDPDGIVFSSSRSSWLYRVLGELSHTELQRIAESQRYYGKSIEKLAIVYQKPFDDKSQEIDILENTVVDGVEVLQRQSFLRMSRPIRLLNFKISILAPLKTINEEISLWRAIFAGGVTITGLLFGLALLRSRMLRERSDANEMTRHNQAYIREVIQNTQAGLVTLDEHYRIESFNPAVEKLVGQPLAPLVGEPLDKLFQPYNKSGPKVSSHDDLLTVANDLGVKVLTREGYLCYSDQAVAVEMALCQMQLPNRLSYLVTFHDMTERKRFEQDITQARIELEERVKERTFELEDANIRLRQEIEEHKGTQRELIQTAKLAVLGQLSAGLNHELNQPLTAIRAFAGNGLKFLDRGQYEQAHANLQHISQLGHHMGDIIARFKVFARKGDVQQGPIAVQTAIMGALKIMTPRYKEVGIELVVAEDKGFLVNGDMVFLEQVLVNLLANAADAILEDINNERRVFIKQRATEDQIEICVQDTGNGLSEEATKHLFEPFFTSKSSGVGLGLGLSISQRIVDVMGGQISAKNLTEGGAEFCVSLPRFKHQSSQSVVTEES
ncbi:MULTISPECIES: ATP-binding protein [Marinomonas]|uniref:C4-dicarboxylate transport sensor protein DctB n=1 Tax=Marinomonas alcarazii TaxID=491949 RepID=A0A318V404_9GAMM|nr:MULTISPECIES: ATP-binding protein [Marinomonas]PYF80945.1 two-component system C4-dicarboxylate transport sensor histidine kinase DctB [Marinomonas alcarazii]